MTEPKYSPQKKPLVFVLSGPSGVGKDAILNRIKEAGEPIEFIVTATTRRRRHNEVNGRDYLFTPRKQFEEMIARNELLEWANVYGNYYGVPKKPVREALEARRDVMVKVDVQGAATIKQALPQAVLIFLAPPSIEELASRLKKRFTESPEALERRLEAAKQEIDRLPMFDYIVVNHQDEIDQAVKEIKAIIKAEKHRLATREYIL